MLLLLLLIAGVELRLLPANAATEANVVKFIELDGFDLESGGCC